MNVRAPCLETSGLRCRGDIRSLARFPCLFARGIFLDSVLVLLIVTRALSLDGLTDASFFNSLVVGVLFEMRDQVGPVALHAKEHVSFERQKT